MRPRQRERRPTHGLKVWGGKGVTRGRTERLGPVKPLSRPFNIWGGMSVTTCYRQSGGTLSASRSNWERSRQASARTGGVHCLSTRTQPRGHDPRVQPLLLRGKRRDVAAIDHALGRRAHLVRVRFGVRVRAKVMLWAIARTVSRSGRGVRPSTCLALALLSNSLRVAAAWLGLGLG